MRNTPVFSAYLLLLALAANLLMRSRRDWRSMEHATAEVEQTTPGQVRHALGYDQVDLHHRRGGTKLHVDPIQALRIAQYGDQGKDNGRLAHPQGKHG